MTIPLSPRLPIAQPRLDELNPLERALAEMVREAIERRAEQRSRLRVIEGRRKAA